MLFLVLAVLCSSGNALIMKFAGSRSGNSRSLIMLNYLTCVALGFALAWGSGVPLTSTPGPVLGMGVVNGVLYILTFVLFQTNIAKNGATVSSSASRLSVVIPVLASVLLFGEAPSALQAAGLAVGLLALLVLTWPRAGQAGDLNGTSVRAARWLLVPQVVASGTIDVLSKVFESSCDASFQYVYMLITFAVACAISVAMTLRSGERPHLFDVGCGVALGTFNYFSSSLLLRAVIELPAFIAFTGFCLGVILVMNAANLAFLKERLAAKDYVAMGIIVAAFALLYAPVN